MIDEKFVKFFLNSGSEVVQLEMFTIEHESFSRTFYLCMNCLPTGITVKHEDGKRYNYEYLPLNIETDETSDDLDQSLSISIGDLGEVLPNELDNVYASNTQNIKPRLVYRSYRSDDLEAPMVGPMVFEMSDLSFNSEGVTFKASAPSLNLTKTGEMYDLERFPMLRAFI